MDFWRIFSRVFYVFFLALHEVPMFFLEFLRFSTRVALFLGFLGASTKVYFTQLSGCFCLCSLFFLTPKVY